MVLNKSKGNMYGFINFTWNPIKGWCPHQCKYCYMHGHIGWEKTLRLDPKEMKISLGAGRFIFVGSSTDMWATDVHPHWIIRVLDHCRKHNLNKYLFQSKNPKRFLIYLDKIPEQSILCTTLESNRQYPEMAAAPPISERVRAMSGIPFRKMLTIEPVMDFDTDNFARMIERVDPIWINIGADSKGHKLKEPNAEKIIELIKILKRETKAKIKLKQNLSRLIGSAEVKNLMEVIA